MDSSKVSNPSYFKQIDQLYTSILQQVSQLNEIFELSQEEIFLWMNQFKWNEEKFQEYYTNASEAEIQVRKVQIGFLYDGETQKTKSLLCPICLENTIKIKLPCNHACCGSCFLEYINEKLQIAPFIPCFQDKCNIFIPHNTIINEYSEIQKYKRMLAKDYAKYNKSIKTCSNEDCNYFLENAYMVSKSPFIECICGETFCIICQETDHRPCSCQQLVEWNKITISQDKKSSQYLIKNSKFCPKCRTPIEKNQGCNHMTCQLPKGCGHEFCWLCLRPWTEHSTETGGHYNCNSFQKQSEPDKNNNKQNLNKEKSDLERLLFYSIRYFAHEEAYKMARTQKSKGMKNLLKLNEASDLEFLKKANIFLIKARNTLRWTYCYGYFLKDQINANIELYEFNQADVERCCEKLHWLIEKKLVSYIKDDKKTEEQFQKLRQSIINQHYATEHFMVSFLKEFHQ